MASVDSEVLSVHVFQPGANWQWVTFHDGNLNSRVNQWQRVTVHWSGPVVETLPFNEKEDLLLVLHVLHSGFKEAHFLTSSWRWRVVARLPFLPFAKDLTAYVQAYVEYRTPVMRIRTDQRKSQSLISVTDIRWKRWRFPCREQMPRGFLPSQCSWNV